MERIGVRILRKRNALDLTQKEFGARVGVSQRQVVFWEQGKDDPSSHRISKIAEILGVSVGWLLTGQEDQVLGVKGAQAHLLPGNPTVIKEDPPWITALVTKIRNLPEEDVQAISPIVDRMLEARAERRRLRLRAKAQTATPPPAQPAYKDLPSPPAPTVQEVPESIRVVPLVRKRKPINRRNELAVYTRCSQDEASRKAPIKHYTGVAAGPGRVIEESTDLLWVREHYPKSNVVSAKVATDSMVQTIIPGDIVLLQTYRGGQGLELPSIGNDDPKIPLSHLRVDVPDGEIYLLTLNEQDPFLKRVRYDTRSARSEDWRLVIEADNPDIWESYPLRRDDRVTFFARVIGLVS